MFQAKQKARLLQTLLDEDESCVNQGKTFQFLGLSTWIGWQAKKIEGH